MTYETLLTELTDGIATVWLNRPHRNNAFNSTMIAELNDAFETLERDDSVRAIVVTGTGRFFSVGADLEGGSDTFTQAETPEQVEAEEHVRRGRLQPRTMRTPVIAAMQGSAVGMALTFPLGWDIRVMCEDAKYGFVFNRIGLVAEANSIWICARVFGLSKTLDLMLSGRIFDGREAVQRGLAVAAYPADEVLPAAQEIARDLARHTSPTSVAITKYLAYRALEEQTRDEADAVLADAFRWMARQPDAREGMMAFLEKRDPRWQMSKTADFPGFL